MVRSLLLVISLYAALLSYLFPQTIEKPKLIIGIVVDQMRFVDLYKYMDHFTEDGFKKLLREGANFTNAYYNYHPTTTGPGHASIYTGTTPYYHGIIGNEFNDKLQKRMVNCVEDTFYETVGSKSANGKKSPKYLLSSTITDELKLFTNFKSKVISISIKDRGAIFPGGFTADGAFWYDPENGNFITSTFYMKDLPVWVKNFNDKKLVDSFLQKSWDLLLDNKIYSSYSNEDNSPFEYDVFNEGKTSFPHKFENLTSTKKYTAFISTPFANELILKFTREAIIHENLGEDEIPDFLAISFSSTDYIGHSWGNFSFELMDTYIRLDRQLGEFIKFLDEKIGHSKYLLFLTSDHGAIETPQILKLNKFPTSELKNSDIINSVETILKNKFKTENLIENFSNGQFFINHKVLAEKNLSYNEVVNAIVIHLRTTYPEIQNIYTRLDFEKQVAKRDAENMTLNGWHPFRSGDVILTLRPYTMSRILEKGTSHSTPYSYDTHIPLIFYGWKIPAQVRNENVYVTDIAATLASLLKIKRPSSCIGVSLF